MQGSRDRLRALIIVTSAFALSACSLGFDRAMLDRITECEARREDVAFLSSQARSTDPLLRRAASHALARIADPASETLLETLAQDSDPLIAREAIFGLGRIDSSREPPALIASLRAADASSRLLAARALGQRGASSSLDYLLAVSADDSQPSVREAATLAIARLLMHAGSQGPAERNAAIEERLATLAMLATTEGQRTAVLRARLALPARWAEPTARATLEAGAQSAAGRERRRAALAWLAKNQRLAASEREAWARDEDLVARRIVRFESIASQPQDTADTMDTDESPLVAVPGRDIPPEFLGSRPLLRFTTTRGEFALAIAPRAAPVHAWLLWQAAHSGRLDSTRIVGDTADGGLLLAPPPVVNSNDGGSWRWPTLRAEPSPMPFARGTLGVVNRGDIDQRPGEFFLTLQSAPELDGRATAIARVVSGFDVVESLAVGDEIAHVIVSERDR